MSRPLRPVTNEANREVASTSEQPTKGLKFSRFFTQAGKDPLDTVEWSKRSAVIRNKEGEVVFEQAGVEAPSSWSDMAVNVVVSRYFRGKIGTEETGKQHQGSDSPSCKYHY